VAALDAEVAHVWRRLGFGAVRSEIDAGMAMGTSALVDSLLARPLVPFASAGFPPATASTDANAMREMELMAFGPSAPGSAITSPQYNPVQERITWMLTGLVVCSQVDAVYIADVRDHLGLLRGALGSNYKQLLLSVSTRPGMLKYLTGHLNTKAHPNQNYGRELLELFSLGRVDAATGQTNYTQTDVVEISRALSGWTYNWGNGTTAFNASLWDSGPKTFLGAPRGAVGLPAVINAIAAHPAWKTYVPARIWKELTGFTATPAILTELAAPWGANGDLKALVTHIAHRPEFVSDQAIFNRTKSPVERMVAAVRLLQYPNLTTDGSIPWLMSLMAQSPLTPPNVSGWPKADQWLNTTNLQVWCQTANMLAMRGFNWAGNVTGTINPTVTQVHQSASSATAAGYVLDLAGLRPASPKTVSMLNDYAGAGPWTPYRAAGLLNLLLMSPEFLAN